MNIEDVIIIDEGDEYVIIIDDGDEDVIIIDDSDEDMNIDEAEIDIDEKVEEDSDYESESENGEDYEQVLPLNREDLRDITEQDISIVKFLPVIGLHVFRASLAISNYFSDCVSCLASAFTLEWYSPRVLAQHIDDGEYVVVTSVKTRIRTHLDDVGLPQVIVSPYNDMSSGKIFSRRRMQFVHQLPSLQTVLLLRFVNFSRRPFVVVVRFYITHFCLSSFNSRS